MSVFLPLVVVRNRWLFRRVVLAFFVVEVLSYIVFMAYPVQYIYRHPTMTTDTFVGWGMQMTYWLDQPYCCLPSMHVSMATLSALVVWKVDRIIGGITLVIAFLIGLSTMFIKQHYFVDMIGGFAVASLGYWLFVANFKTADIPVHELRYARRWSLLLPALYIAAIAVLYVAYRMGWQPWATA
jgi:membrane-associated phospholipid phosphatase